MEWNSAKTGSGKSQVSVHFFPDSPSSSPPAQTWCEGNTTSCQAASTMFSPPTRKQKIPPRKQKSSAYKTTELGTRQSCRVNVTMFSGHTAVCYCNITIFVVDTKTLLFFAFFLVPEALLRCRAVVVVKLKVCCVPSSAKL